MYLPKYILDQKFPILQIFQIRYLAANMFGLIGHFAVEIFALVEQIFLKYLLC